MRSTTVESMAAVSYSFAGPGAATADVHSLATARTRLAGGENSELVRKETGWHLGPDGKWRFEISDATAAFSAQEFSEERNRWYPARFLRDARDSGNPIGGTGLLGATIDHPRLFAAYPALRGIPISARIRAGQPAEGSYNGKTIDVQAPDEEALLDAIIHEIAHAIQDRESFARGGSIPRMAELSALARQNAEVCRAKLDVSSNVLAEEARRLVAARATDAEAENFVASAYQRWMDEFGPRSEDNPYGVTHETATAFELQGTDPSHQHLAHSYEETLYVAALDPVDGYRRLAGEVEARNAATRRRLTDAEIAEISPLDTADVPLSDLIVTFNGRDLARAMLPANCESSAQAVARVRGCVEALVGPVALRKLMASSGMSIVTSRALCSKDEAIRLRPLARGHVVQAWTEGPVGKVTLIADRIEPGREAAVFLHEIVHKQGARVVGEAGMRRLVDGVKGWASSPLASMERRIHDVASAKARAAAGSAGAVHDEELFAYAVEEAVAAGVRPTLEGREGSAEQWLGDVVATLRGAIFQITQGAAPELDAQQIVDLAYALAQMESPDRARGIMEALTEGAGSQRGYGANVMPVYLALQNPRIVDFDGAGLEFLADEIATAKESGNDGLIAIDYDDGGRATHYLAFKPEQIKSALGNSGVFEPNSQDIRYSLDPGQSVSSNGDLRFMSELQQCGDRFEAGFHFEEGGCWGMALALQEAVGGELFMRDGEFVHVYCRLEGQLYDWQGTAPAAPGRVIDREALLALAAVNGVDKETLQADYEWAHQIIQAAREEAQNTAGSNSLRFSFAGSTAATADLKAHDDAVAAVDAEVDAEQIRQRTGWFLGTDNKWRFEIDDSMGFTKGEGTFGEIIMKWYRLGVERTGDQLYRTRVADLIWHTDLFKAYPQLRDIEVRMMPAGIKAQGSLMHESGDNENPVLLVQEGLPSRKWYSVMMHELQHQIQVIEGFAMGGGRESFGPVPFDLAREEGLIGQGLTDEQIKASLYRRLAGEVEARNTQSRLSMDREQRVSTPPMATADTPVGQQLVRFRDPATGGLRFSFAGQLANTADSSMLCRAQALISQGESSEAVRKATGWHQGVDRQWRFEISDAGASLLRESSNPQVYADIFDEAKHRKGGVPLAKVLEHPVLYAAYPKLQALRLVINDDMPAECILVAADNELHMKAPYSYQGGHAEFLSNCCHEVQHWIQRTEGFARGGSPLGMQRYAIEESRKDLESRFGDLPSYRKAVADKTTDQWTLDAIQATGIGIAPHEAYWRLAGEVEARSVQARLKMSPDERMVTAPSASADVAEHEQILLSPGGSVGLQPDALKLLAA